MKVVAPKVTTVFLADSTLLSSTTQSLAAAAGDTGHPNGKLFNQRTVTTMRKLLLATYLLMPARGTSLFVGVVSCPKATFSVLTSWPKFVTHKINKRLSEYSLGPGGAVV